MSALPQIVASAIAQAGSRSKEPDDVLWACNVTLLTEPDNTTSRGEL